MNASRLPIYVVGAALICGSSHFYLNAQNAPQSELSEPAEATPVKGSSSEARGAKMNTPESQRLSERLAAYEQQAAGLAEQIRTQSKLPREAGTELPRLTQLRHQLDATLAAAIDVKFQIEQLQLQELQARLSRLERQIGERKAQRQKIIERRANELIGNDLTNWEIEPAETATPDGFRSPGIPSADTPNAVFGRQTVEPTIDGPEPGVTTFPIVAGERFPAGKKVVSQIELTGPPGMEAAFELAYGAPQARLPHRLKFVLSNSEARYPVQFLPAQGPPLSGSLTIAPVKRHTRFFWEAGIIPLTITNDDINQVNSGRHVTKVIYISEDSIRNHAKAKAETLVSTRLDPNVDAEQEADRRGAVLAVLSLSPGQEKLPTAPQRIQLSGPDGFKISAEPWRGSNHSYRTVPLPLTHNVRRPSESKPEWTFFSPGPQTLFGTLYVSPMKTHTQFFWQLDAIAMAITREDLDEVAAGNSVTKVVYLSEKSIRDRTHAIAETLESTGLYSGNPVKEADIRGAVLAVLHLTSQELVPRIQLSGPAGMTAVSVAGKPAPPMPFIWNSASPLGSQHSWQFQAGSGRTLFGALEISPVKGHTHFFWQSQVIPMTITDEDIDQVISGNVVTKVVYLSESSISQPDLAKAETLVSTEMQPGVDVEREAEQRGAVLAVLKLGSSPEKRPQRR